MLGRDVGRRGGATEHPFVTVDGPKAIASAKLTTRAGHPLGRLAVGDRLRTLAGTEAALTAVTAQPAPPETQRCNLVVDGNQTYHGYGVLMAVK